MQVVLNKKRIKWPLIIATLLVIIAILNIPTTYYLYQPGTIEPLHTYVTVEDGSKNGNGSFSLSTVYSFKADRLYLLLYGLIAPDTEIRRVSEVQRDLSDQEYDLLLNHMMTGSQQYAIAAAFRASKEAVNVQNHGIFVADVPSRSKAAGKLSVGDIITSADGHKTANSAALREYLHTKKAGESVAVTFLRNGVERNEQIETITLHNTVGLGIMIEDEITVEPGRVVSIDVNGVGGSSAGLMLSLEIINQLTSGGIAKGYKIAGTGTIDQDGQVGQIGSIRHKIVAAHQAGVDIFFCPADINSADKNTNDVLDEAKQRGYDIIIVPVKTLQEALDYISSLTPK